jgi:hypothetical protein
MNERTQDSARSKMKGSQSTATGIDRISCAWRDAVGPGFAIGFTDRVASVVLPLGADKYCR